MAAASIFLAACATVDGQSPGAARNTPGTPEAPIATVAPVAIEASAAAAAEAAAASAASAASSGSSASGSGLPPALPSVLPALRSILTPGLSPALAARFPEPAARYITPGLKDGRTQWSTPEEAATWLRELAAPPAVRQRTSRFKATVLNLNDPAEAAETATANARLYALHLSNASRTARSAGAGASTGTEADAGKESPWRPTVLLIAGREPSAATEALLVVARELVQGKMRPLLARITVIVVPSTNINEAVQPAAIPALASPTDSPAEDHVQLNTARARMLAQLAQAHHATVVLTADETSALDTFGSQAALRLADVVLDHARQPDLPEFLIRAADQWFQQPMQAALQAEALRVDRLHSLLDSTAAPKVEERSSTNASALKNRIGLELLTAGRDLGRAHAQRRVHAQVTAISSALASAAKRATELAELKPYLDREVTAQACRQAVLVNPARADLKQAALGQTQGVQWLDLNTGAEIALAPAPRSATPTQAALPVRTRIKPCGYWLSAESAPAVERLRMHGVQVMRVAEPASLLGDTYQPAQSTAQAHDLTLVRGVIDAPVDSFYVPVDQPFGNLAMAALEPDAPSSFLAHGLVNSTDGLARIMAPPAVRLEPFP